VTISDLASPQLVQGADGALRLLNEEGFLDAADVHVARRLATLASEPDEAVQLAVAVAVRAVRGGSTCVDLGSVARLVPDFSWPEPSTWVESVEQSVLVAEGVLHLDGSLLYLARYWEEERQVVDDLRSRDRRANPPAETESLETALAAYFPGTASDDQREAARIACTRWTSVVTGGPGTGKTTTIARLLGVLLSLDPTARVALAAPTGKAAARLTQALHEATRRDDFPEIWLERIRALEAGTLHRLLGWRSDSSTRFRHDRRNRLPYDVVVVDETSMMSLTLTARLLEAVRPEARLVLVGDADQLASVEAGAVLRDVVDGWSGGPVRTLATAHRFGRNIRELALAVNDGRADDVVALVREGRRAEDPADGEVRWAEAGPELDTRLASQALAVHGAAVAGDVTAALAAFERHRLLCAHREGPFGVAEWNRRIERLLLDALRQDWLDEWYAGRPFIVNGNDRGLRLWNGDTGVACVMPSADGAGRRLVGVVGDSASSPRSLATTRLADVSTAHAMTVHRSQGSQFDEVTVLLPEPDSRILTRELLYTAVTRARSVVRIVGSEESLRAAVTRRAERATGLARRLTS
jgi:exodeoxyribonuclease V alpha subunit